MRRSTSLLAESTSLLARVSFGTNCITSDMIARSKSKNRKIAEFSTMFLLLISSSEKILMLS